MSIRTKKPRGAAAARMRAQVVAALRPSTSSPSCVSFSEMLRSMPAATIASIIVEVLARRRVGFVQVETLSPR